MEAHPLPRARLRWSGHACFTRAFPVMLAGATMLVMPMSQAQPLRGTTVVSSAPVASSVTVYRDPGRQDGRFNLRWLRGYALISEKRRVSLPAGESIVRFEGVADGMIAVSAVVTGIPGYVEEKNRDARLLSPASLLDGSLGNRVQLRRTNRKTGKVTETDAIVRSGPDNAVVLETAEGVEALRCSGLPETLVYDTVPDGLSAKPSFSIQTNSTRAQEAEVTLTYLATGFDWGASYVATIADDGKTLDLFAWLTVANANSANFDQAQLLAVAGEPNRSSDFNALSATDRGPSLSLSCWPMDGTSTVPSWGVDRPVVQAEAMYDMVMAPAPAPMMASAMRKAEVAVMAGQEDLGDLKLYRVPVPVDVAPNGQKQVTMIQRTHVPFTSLYTGTLNPWNGGEVATPLAITLRMQNRTADGLGLPLPSGGVTVMQSRGQEERLLADSRMADKAIGEKVEIIAGVSDQIFMTQRDVVNTDKEKRFILTLSNAQSHKVQAEINVPRLDGFTLQPIKGLKDKEGGKLWALTLPANGKAQIEIGYRRQ